MSHMARGGDAYAFGERNALNKKVGHFRSVQAARHIVVVGLHTAVKCYAAHAPDNTVWP